MKDASVDNSTSTDIPMYIDNLRTYYQYHSIFYDLTRWSFLFGRKKIMDLLPDLPHNPRIVEVGCGTGKNLERLEYLFPDGTIYGLDLSKDMIQKAHKNFTPNTNVNLIHTVYGLDKVFQKPVDLILLSYTLTMTGNNIEHILQNIYDDLKPGGAIAVVDFHDTPLKWFNRWMKTNHVDIDGRLHPLLNKFFTPVEENISKAYFGIWSYLIFIGKRK